MRQLRRKWGRFVAGAMAAILLTASFSNTPTNASGLTVSAGDTVSAGNALTASDGDTTSAGNATVSASDALTVSADAPLFPAPRDEAADPIELTASGDDIANASAESLAAPLPPQDPTDLITEDTAAPSDLISPQPPAEIIRPVRSDATADVYYENKLSFSIKKKTVYTGQQNLYVGEVKFSSKTNYFGDVSAVVYDKRGEAQKGFACSYQSSDGKLYLSVDPYVLPGSYSLKIFAGVGEAGTAGAPQSGSMYQSNATVALTVRSGITGIDTSAIARQIVVSSKKSTTFSAAPVGYSYYEKAKSQKFTYEIKSAYPSGGGFAATEPTSNVRDNITVASSGKVTVKKGFEVSNDASRNVIAIEIKAADYTGNETTATAFVRLSDEALVPTSLYLADSSGARLATRLTADVANGAHVVVLDQYGNNMNEYVTLTPADNSKYTAKAYITHYSGAEAWFYVRKTGSFTVTATAKDGGKKSKSVKITVTAPDTSDVRYKVVSVANDGVADPFTVAAGIVTYSAPRGAVIKMQQGARIKGIDYYNTRWFGWKYALTGGTLKTDGDYWLITPSAEFCELKCWMASDSGKYWTIKFVNSNWNKSYPAAPKLTLQEGKLYSIGYSSREDLQYYYDTFDGREHAEVPAQQLRFTYNNLTGCDNIRITTTSKTAPQLWVSDHNSTARSFRLNMDPDTAVQSGTYSYKVAFSKNGELMCKPVTLKIKVYSSPIVKITSAYTLKLASGDRVALKSTPSGFVPDYDAVLMNANESGRANNFNEYFELIYNTDDTGAKKAYIRFRYSVSEEERRSLKKKKLTGYVRYSYYYGHSEIKNATAKVTITVK